MSASRPIPALGLAILCACGRPADEAAGPARADVAGVAEDGATAARTGAPNPPHAGPRPGRSGRPWLRDATLALGVDFAPSGGRAPEGELTYALPALMGGGVALFDADGDDRLDLYLVDWDGPNRLLVQVETPAGPRFEARESGLEDPGVGMGSAVGDFDRDGDLDLYVTNLGPDRLYRNEGGGRFVDATAELGIAVSGWSTSAAFVDLDGDGWLDLYVARYVRWDPEVACAGLFEQPDWCGPRMFAPEADVLLMNASGRAFRDVSSEAGLDAAPAAGLGVVCGDLDGDGRVDVFVANDAWPNQLWALGPERAHGTIDGGAGGNRLETAASADASATPGTGRLVDLAPELGLALNGDGAAEAGMGVVLAPLSEPGHLEVLQTHLRDETSTLYRRAEGARGFEDVTEQVGLGAPSRPFTGFGVAAFDLELDGDLDLAVANGGVNRFEPSPYSELPLPWRELAEPDHLFLNDGRGRFAPAPEAGGPLCRTVRISRGLATGDLDRDGDLDLVVTALIEPARVLLNEAPRKGRWLALRVLERPGPAGGRAEALGATVRVRAGGREHLRVVGRASSYLSSSDGEVHLGLGPLERYDGIEVLWSDGTRSAFPGGACDRRVTLARPEAPETPKAREATR